MKSFVFTFIFYGECHCHRSISLFFLLSIVWQPHIITNDMQCMDIKASFDKINVIVKRGPLSYESPLHHN